MNSKRIVEATILGAFLCAGLVILGFLISSSVVKIKSLDRTVTVKGLSEREVAANIAIWPVKFSEADNDLSHFNEIKPEMIEEATKNARKVAAKFAKDSDSRLGKIKKARQGQFSINDRDSNTPHIKKVRVVSTLEYYLSD
jgi:hypothetical protein